MGTSVNVFQDSFVSAYLYITLLFYVLVDLKIFTIVEHINFCF